MKNPASEKHLTFVVEGRRSRNLSQCNIDANPPAEQPERRACSHFVYAFKGAKSSNNY